MVFVLPKFFTAHSTSHLLNIQTTLPQWSSTIFPANGSGRQENMRRNNCLINTHNLSRSVNATNVRKSYFGFLTPVKNIMGKRRECKRHLSYVYWWLRLEGCCVHTNATNRDGKSNHSPQTSTAAPRSDEFSISVKDISYIADSKHSFWIYIILS